MPVSGEGLRGQFPGGRQEGRKLCAQTRLPWPLTFPRLGMAGCGLLCGHLAAGVCADTSLSIALLVTREGRGHVLPCPASGRRVEPLVGGLAGSLIDLGVPEAQGAPGEGQRQLGASEVSVGFSSIHLPPILLRRSPKPMRGGCGPKCVPGLRGRVRALSLVQDSRQP